MKLNKARLEHAKLLTAKVIGDHGGKILTTLLYEIIELAERDAFTNRYGETHINREWVIDELECSPAIRRQLEDMLSMPADPDYPKHTIWDEIIRPICDERKEEWMAERELDDMVEGWNKEHNAGIRRELERTNQ